MSSRRNNIYRDESISRAFGNIANILTGSAADDANIARGRYYDSQTVGQNQKNKNVSDLQASIPNTTNTLAGQMLKSFTGEPNAGFNQSQVPFIDGGNMSKPISGDTSVLPNNSYSLDNLTSVARSMLGDLSYKPNQFADALNTIGKSEKSKLAQNMIQKGDAEAIRRGAIMQGGNPGQYFDSGTAQTKIANDLSGTLDKNNKSLEASQYNTDQDNITKKEDAKQKRIITKELGIAKIESVAATAKYKFDNREITIAVGKDQKVYIDQTTADTLGVEPTIENGEKVYVINGKASPNKVDQVKVQVGKADVFLSKEMADELGIPVNDQGQYVIKGSGFKDSTSNKNNGGLKQKDVNDSQRYFKNAYESYEKYNELPSNVIGNIQQIIYKNIAKDLKEEVPRDQAFSSNVEGVVSQGVVQITNPLVGEDLVAPKYFVNYFQKNPKGTVATLETVVKFFGSLGYDDNDSKAIANFIKGL